MARLNEILAGRFARGLQRVFQIKGPVPVATLAPEIMPVHVIMNSAEQRYLEGWNRFGWGAELAAVAAQNLALQIRNPANSGMIAVVESITVSCVVANVITIDSANGGALVDLTTIGSYANLDGRLGNQIKGASIVSFQSTTASSNTLIADVALGAGFNASFIADENQEIPLVPNSQLRIRTNVNNADIHLTLTWRERVIEDSETK